MADTLTQLYVDITARNLRETMDALRAIQRQADATGESFKRMKAQAGGPNMGGAARGGMAGSMTNMATVGAIAGGIGIAVGAVAGVVKAGLGGSAEMEQFTTALANISREVGNLFAPALRLATDLLNMLTSTFRGTGSAGQFLLMMVSPLTAAFEVLGNSRVQSSIKNLFTSFGMIVQAIQPLLNMVANLQMMMLDTFVVGPLVEFTNALTIGVLLMTELAKRAVQVVQAAAGFAGFGRLFDRMQRPRSESTLNQTGTEDAAGTFQRIQQAVFKASSGEPQDVQDKQLAELEEIKRKVEKIVTWAEAFFQNLAGVVNKVPIDAPAMLAQGAVSGGPTGFGQALGAIIARQIYGGR